jgi:hypothetical protein
MLSIDLHCTEYIYFWSKSLSISNSLLPMKCLCKGILVSSNLNVSWRGKYMLMLAWVVAHYIRDKLIKTHWWVVAHYILQLWSCSFLRLPLSHCGLKWVPDIDQEELLRSWDWTFRGWAPTLSHLLGKHNMGPGPLCTVAVHFTLKSDKEFFRLPTSCTHISGPWQLPFSLCMSVTSWDIDYAKNWPYFQFNNP